MNGKNAVIPSINALSAQFKLSLFSGGGGDPTAELVGVFRHSRATQCPTWLVLVTTMLESGNLDFRIAYTDLESSSVDYILAAE